MNKKKQKCREYYYNRNKEKKKNYETNCRNSKQQQKYEGELTIKSFSKFDRFLKFSKE